MIRSRQQVTIGPTAIVDVEIFDDAFVATTEDDDEIFDSYSSMTVPWLRIVTDTSIEPFPLNFACHDIGIQSFDTVLNRRGRMNEGISMHLLNRQRDSQSSIAMILIDRSMPLRGLL